MLLLSIVVDSGASPQRRHLSKSPLIGHLHGCPSSDYSVDPRSFASLNEPPLEPRGVPAVQIFPLMSSVYRGRNDADRVEEMVSGPPSDFAFLPVFLPEERSSSPAVHPVITPGYYRCVASPSASRVSSGLGREPFETHFPSSFPPFARRCVSSGTGRSGSCRVCLFPPLPWVKVVTANRWGDEECISASRARSSHSPRTILLPAARNKTEVLSLCGCVQF